MTFRKRGGGVGTGPGGGGGGNPVRSNRAEPVVFFARWEDKAGLQADDFADAAAEVNVMEISATDVLINKGGFTVETANGVSEVVICGGRGLQRPRSLPDGTLGRRA